MRRTASWTRQRITVVLLGFLLTARSAVAVAQPPPPLLTAPVNDYAHVIDPGSARELDRRIRALQEATGDTVVVATVNQVAPYADIDELAVKMFENGGRGIGSRGKENGVLVVVAVKDRRVRIEVGYGIEGIITDGIAGQIIRESMTPRFKTGDYGGGLLAGVTAIINRIAQERGVSLQSVPRQPPPRRGTPGLPIIPIIIFIVIALATSRQNRRRRRYWGGGPWSGWNSGAGPFGGGFGGFGGFGGGFGGGGGGGGGFGGFGGGRSGGGGASGGW
jgi:uncharacterized protein